MTEPAKTSLVTYVRVLYFISNPVMVTDFESPYRNRNIQQNIMYLSCNYVLSQHYEPAFLNTL